MAFTTILFYLFSFVLISSALVVVSTRNMVHSVMFLILAFFNAAALFVLLGAEFIAMLLIVVYVGAIAVLFLFVVMMLNVDKSELKTKISLHTPLLLCIAIVFFLEIFLVTKISSAGNYQTATLFPTPADVHNVNALGNILYTKYFLPFQLAGGVLFVAMIGAILLTLRERNRFIKKQKISDQVFRTQANSLEIVKVKTGEGIEL